MAQLTQKTAQQLTNSVINTIVDRINEAICFYKKRPTTKMKISLEETLLDVVPFIRIVADQSSNGQLLDKKVMDLSHRVFNHLPIHIIELPTELESE